MDYQVYGLLAVLLVALLRIFRFEGLYSLHRVLCLQPQTNIRNQLIFYYSLSLRKILVGKSAKFLDQLDLFWIIRTVVRTVEIVEPLGKVHVCIFAAFV